MFVKVLIWAAKFSLPVDGKLLWSTPNPLVARFCFFKFQAEPTKPRLSSCKCQVEATVLEFISNDKYCRLNCSRVHRTVHWIYLLHSCLVRAQSLPSLVSPCQFLGRSERTFRFGELPTLSLDTHESDDRWLSVVRVPGNGPQTGIPTGHSAAHSVIRTVIFARGKLRKSCRNKS